MSRRYGRRRCGCGRCLRASVFDGIADWVFEQKCQRKLFRDHRGQGIKQRFHPLRAVNRVADKFIRLRVEPAPILSCQHLCAAHYHAQRFLEVMGRRVGEVL